MKQKLISAIYALVMVCLSAGLAVAQPVSLDIMGAGNRIINVAIADPIADGGRDAPANGPKLDALIRENLSFLPFVRLIDRNAILGGSKLASYKMPGIDFKPFTLAGSQLVITAGWTDGSTVEMRVYEPTTGQLVFGKSYSDVQEKLLPKVADRFCAEFMKSLVGNGDFFLSTLAFIKSSGKDRHLWLVRPTGRELRQINNMPGLSMSPSWSPDARFVIFTHIDDRTHALAVWDRMTQQTQRVKFPGNTIIGPAFLPDNRVAVSLAMQGYPNIYLLDRSFKRDRVLESSGGIDVSPSFDATGTKMVFTSSRLGNPHVFLKNLSTGQVTRVSQDGKYNTDPSISPDGTLVAYARMVGSGQHRIFVHDLLTGMERQVTFGPGSDEQPAFAPDSYFIAFMSTRSGQPQIYLTTRHGGDAKRVPTGNGDARFPAWGMIPDQ